MTSPSGAESPSSIGPFLVWQQPHPIYFAELVHRERGDRATLERFRDVVFETAEFLASFASWDEAGQRYVLGPPLQGAQEIFPRERTFNTTFELAYWRWGLEAAQLWRERLGLAREPRRYRLRPPSLRQSISSLSSHYHERSLPGSSLVEKSTSRSGREPTSTLRTLPLRPFLSQRDRLFWLPQFHTSEILGDFL